ncbi:hypothetical protein PGTUg99_029578 [Puccinia graminis f. sp. tritici]|uniref:Uncharacterized protein n=1 Tax=Puccinia graminis f. sp. tritici TaxID=56615 RepID=A0A5B0MDF0_PUCGR|nr:hypothetical protein PGTUg99_029578 [Puccinia graminis f. sp. tritici]
MYPPARLWYPLLSRRSLTSNDRRCRANSLFGSDADDVCTLYVHEHMSCSPKIRTAVQIRFMTLVQLEAYNYQSWFFLTAAGAAKEDRVMNFDGVYVTARHSLFSASPRPVPPEGGSEPELNFAVSLASLSGLDIGTTVLSHVRRGSSKA